MFGLHPLRVESVAWVTERKDVLSTLFLILTVAAYVRYAERPDWRRCARTVRRLLPGLDGQADAGHAAVRAAAARLLAAQSPSPRPKRAGSVCECADDGLALADRRKNPAAGGGGGDRADHLAFRQPGHRRQRPLASSPRHRPFRLSRLSGKHLLARQPGNALSGQSPVGRLAHPFAAFVLAGITIAALYLARRQPAIIVGWLWFLGTMFPVSGIVQTGPQALADRYTYVPHLGLAVAIVWGISDSALWPKLSASMQKAVAGLVLAGLGALTWMQVGYWRDSELLFEHTLSVTKDNYLIHQSLSAYLESRGNTEQAEAHLIKAVNIAPRNVEMRLAYGMMLEKQGRANEAAVQFQEAVRIKPDDPDAHYLLGRTLVQLGDDRQAQEHWQLSIECWTRQPMRSPFLGSDLAYRRAQPHIALAELALRSGRSEDALPQLNRALEIKPKQPETLQMTGIALSRLARWSDAEAAFQNALLLESDNASTQGYLAVVHAGQGKQEQAEREYAGILKSHPDWPEKTADFALALIGKARPRDPLTAQELALQVCQATGFKDARWLGTLAAAQAANGDFAKARATVQQALALNPPAAFDSELRDRLRLYEKNQASPTVQHVK